MVFAASRRLQIWLAGLLAFGAAIAACQSIPTSGGGIEDAEHAGASTLDIIRARGFYGQLFHVRSPDGTILSVYRLINPLANLQTVNRFPVLIVHGLAADSSQMLTHSSLSRPLKPTPGQLIHSKQDDNLAFKLVNNNFDVWLADSRGVNLNSRNLAVDLDFSQSTRYWNYTLDEQAQLDLPTMIDFVLAQTQSEKLHYIGYSQSTFFIFALLSHQPQYQLKMASVVAMAPIAYVAHITGVIVAMLSPLASLPDNMNFNAVPTPVFETLGQTVQTFCDNNFLRNTVCAQVLRSMQGDGGLTDTSIFYRTTLKSTSTKALKHFGQLFLDRRFGMYDYGRAGNLRQYGQLRPPHYQLANIRLPTIILVRGDHDFLSTPQDAQLLLSQLGARPYLDLTIPGAGHYDFQIGDSVVSRVIEPTTEAMFEILNLLTGGRVLRDKPQQLIQLPEITTDKVSHTREAQLFANLKSHTQANNQLAMLNSVASQLHFGAAANNLKLPFLQFG